MRNGEICLEATYSISLNVLIFYHKYTVECWAQDYNEDVSEVPTSEFRTENTRPPTQFLDVDGREYLSWCLCSLAFKLMY